VNKVIIIGRLGGDPELHSTQAGTAVANFNLATSESWKDKDGSKQERTEWHRVVVWGKLADLCTKYLSKGSLAMVEGKLQTRKWQDKDGHDRHTTEVVAMTVKFLEPKGGGSKNADDNLPASGGPDDENEFFQH
jgi:single-strand DNA-binding protein